MTKPLNVSYSKLDTFKSCPRKYELQHKKYIIPDHIPSPFFFGGAIDSASEIILADKMIGEKKVPYDEQRLIDTFTLAMTQYTFQLETVFLPTSHLPKYSKSDIDVSLLTDKDKEDIKEFAIELGGEFDFDLLNEFMEETHNAMKKGRDKVDLETLRLYNYIAWKGLYNKGLMMLDALKKWVDENIEEVYDCQRRIEITNDSGDVLRGAIDIECKMKNGVRRTLDLKTAANGVQQYPDGCTDTAMQLHIYAQESVSDVGYLVIDKPVRKREPRIRIRYVEGTATEEMLDDTFEFIEDLMDEIKECTKNGDFPMNKDACFSYGKCAYYGLCMYNKMDGLVKRKFEEKKDEY